MSEDNKSHNTKRNIDWDDLRAKSLNSGGFGKERTNIWPKLLNVSQSERRIQKDVDPTDVSPHHDERQIGLDTDRSFVLYPVDPKYDKEALQIGLHQLLVSLFRKRPRLNYFQGYHDIATVVFLTMPEELWLPCIEKLSLHRLRDSMGSGLEPVLGLLRVLKNLLRLADRDYADVLERSSPLPFHALSNLLTLFSHDVPTLPLIQHVFDYLLSRPPIATVYLTAAIILSRKQDVNRLEEEGDDCMVHSLLSSLPDLSDGVEPEPFDPMAPTLDLAEDLPPSDLDSAYKSENTEISLSTLAGAHDVNEYSVQDLQMERVDQGVKVERVETVDIPMVNGVELNEDVATNSSSASVSGQNDTESDTKSHVYQLLDVLPTNSPLEPPSPSANVCHAKSVPSACGADEAGPESRSPAADEQRNTDTCDDAKQSLLVNDTRSLVVGTLIDDTKDFSTQWKSPNPGGRRVTLLTDLLHHADALYAEFPPTHADLHLSSIMGPQSVIFTWSESFSELPSDGEAEAMVQHPGLIVYPYVDIEQEKEAESSGFSEDEKALPMIRWGVRRQKGKEKADVDKSGAKKLRKKNARRRSSYSQVDKSTMVASAVLVLGVAVAIYGIKTRNGNVNGLFLSFAQAHSHASAQTSDWKRVGSWMVGTLSTIGEKLGNVLSGSGS